MFLSLLENANELSSIVVGARTLPLNLTIDEVTGILATISHQKHTFTCLLSFVERTLVLEVGVRVGVAALSMAQLGHRVDSANIPVTSHPVLEVTLVIRNVYLLLQNAVLLIVLAGAHVHVLDGSRVTPRAHRHLHLAVIIDEVIIAQLHRHLSLFLCSFN